MLEFSLSEYLTDANLSRLTWIPALSHVPIVATMYQTLHQKDNRQMRADFFLDILDEYYSANEAMRQFETAVDWGRYAELFEYEASERRLSLPSNDQAH